ncbi:MULTISPECIES: GTPase HflX [Bartonella]|uniref:GTPase HflX n=1 Tax=Bartonella TaxID=773 RepID=UPI0018DBE134|nr:MULTISPECIES: GTPase HflX [Bartonella]MBH9975366.1 GTPase HflX [Bartonella choladocola]MBI0014973.1 GTPase HflX [Bartonella sp. B10834G3]
MTDDDKAHKLISRQTVATRAIVIVPVIYERENAQKTYEASTRSRIDEAVGLAEAIRLQVVEKLSVNIDKPRPATLLGQGKVAEIGKIIAEKDVELTIIDSSLTPIQQRNLEKEWSCKVIDRTALILEIFGDRARTKEGVLQVELAHLNYQKGRLVRSWTHLERQRGGSGFLGGPGETQIESDRRILQSKIVRIKRELDTVVRTRALHRAKRKKVPYPVVALVGYTNAGKSTLFNRLTGADVLAKDMLFATLDPTLRKIILPHEQTVMLSDTVGFISDLPTHLVAAFRATLEEVVEADLILHVRDMSDVDNHAHAQDVLNILSSLGVNIDNPDHIIEVWNKVDLLDDVSRAALEDSARASLNPVVTVSALTGAGIDKLLGMIEKQISGEMVKRRIVLKPAEYGLLDWLYNNGEVLEKKPEDDGSLIVTANLTVQANDRLNNMIKTKPSV